MLETTSALGQFIMNYGYLAVLLGSVMKSAALVLAAGFFAHQGYLSLSSVMLCVFFGTTLGDLGLFFLARYRGKHLLARFPAVAAKVETLCSGILRKRWFLICFALVFRFLYGLRNLGPLVLGMSTLSTSRFVVCNLLGAAAWAAVFACAGFYFARVIQSFSANIAYYEAPVACLLLLAALAFQVWHRRREERKKPLRRTSETDSPG